jgi:hypothetical protein
MGSVKNGYTDSLGYASKSFLSIHLIAANSARNDSAARHGGPMLCDGDELRVKQVFQTAIPGDH